MSRSKDLASRRVFDRLYAVLRESGNFIENLEETRWVAGGIEDQDILEHACVADKYEPIPGKKCLIVTHKDISYLVTVGFGSSAIVSEYLEFTPTSAGFFTLVVSELDVDIVTHSPLDIIQEVMPQYRGFECYSGHCFQELQRFFEPIYVYRITPNCPVRSDDIFGILGLFLCDDGSLLSLEYDEELLNGYRQIFMIESEWVPREHMILSLCSTSFKHAFLDLYRCIEMLYPLTYADDLRSNMNLTTSLVDLANRLQDQLSWRPNERNTCGRIFSRTDARRLTDLVDASGYQEEEKLANWIYDIRCNVVHLKPKQDNRLLGTLPWPKILKGMLAVIDYWYRTYSPRL